MSFLIGVREKCAIVRCNKTYSIGDSLEVKAFLCIAQNHFREDGNGLPDGPRIHNPAGNRGAQSGQLVA
jgi:hypothetical protein